LSRTFNYKELTRSEKRAIIGPLENEPGYILDFSNRTIEEFFEDEFGIQMYDEAYEFNGTSKKKRLEALLETVDGTVAAKVLSKLWDYRATLPEHYHANNPDAEAANKNKYFAALDKLVGNPMLSVVGTSEALDNEPALSDVVAAIERDIREDAHNAALDRLHTYCQKKLRLLLEAKGTTVSKNDPLHSRMGKYVGLLVSKGQHSDMTIEILGNARKMFEKFNAIRNDETLAHDNDLIDARQARFIFESVLCVLKFMKSIDNNSFGE
jgi:hypothetical protein